MNTTEDVSCPEECANDKLRWQLPFLFFIPTGISIIGFIKSHFSFIIRLCRIKKENNKESGILQEIHNAGEYSGEEEIIELLFFISCLF